MGATGSIAGHLYTVWPFLSGTLARLPGHSHLFRVPLHDERRGPLHLTGRLGHPAPGSAELLLVVHGLGGSAQSAYAIRSAWAAHALGMSCLRLNLRGADRAGGDYYHAALTDDLRAALASPQLADFDRIYMIGFSLGGHLALRYAANTVVDARVRGVAAISAPLDLSRSADAFDRPRWSIYRRHVLDGLREIYGSVARTGPVPVSMAEARAIEHIRRWDDRIVAPRHGFASAEDYYERASVASSLASIAVPCLIVHGESDPMVPLSTVEAALAATSSTTEVVRVRGGHVGFPSDLDLGMGGARGLENQVLAWLRKR